MNIKALLFCLLLVNMSFAQKLSHLDGTVNISLEDETIDATYTLSNLPVDTQTLSFRLNEYIKVKSIELNGDRIASSKVPQNCNDCLIYTVLVGCEVVITPESTLTIETEGKFKNFDKPKSAKRYKGELVYSNGVLRATNADKWYPEIVNKSSNVSDYMNPFNYTYAITANCTDCESIYLGKGKPQPSGTTFTNDQVEGDLILLAGNLKYTTGKYANYINVPQDKIPALEATFEKTRGFLQDITQVTSDSKVVYAQVSSPVYGNEASYNTIINTSQNVDVAKIDDAIGEGEAYYYLSDAFKPETQLDRMLLQSLAKYVKLRYLKKYSTNQYNTLNSFIESKTANTENRLASNQNELNALLISPEQFKILENEIGEAEMNTFISNIFQNLKIGKLSMQAFTDSFAQIQLANKSERFAQLEKNLLTQFELRATIPEAREVLTEY